MEASIVHLLDYHKDLVKLAYLVDLPRDVAVIKKNPTWLHDTLQNAKKSMQLPMVLSRNKKTSQVLDLCGFHESHNWFQTFQQWCRTMKTTFEACHDRWISFHHEEWYMSINIVYWSRNKESISSKINQQITHEMV